MNIFHEKTENQRFSLKYYSERPRREAPRAGVPVPVPSLASVQNLGSAGARVLCWEKVKKKK